MLGLKFIHVSKKGPWGVKHVSKYFFLKNAKWVYLSLIPECLKVCRVWITSRNARLEITSFTYNIIQYVRLYGLLKKKEDFFILWMTCFLLSYPIVWHVNFQIRTTNVCHINYHQAVLLCMVFQTLRLYSLSGRTSYRKISWNLEAARFGVRLL